MARDCVTHHHACDCREERFRELEAENERLRSRLGAAEKAMREVVSHLQHSQRAREALSDE